uniref:Uncharacterized protein n=1 Tax=Anguilla anguilla TaxID=7936 RepID=A0A0E9V7W9_ANGAN
MKIEGRQSFYFEGLKILLRN